MDSDWFLSVCFVLLGFTANFIHGYSDMSNTIQTEDDCPSVDCEDAVIRVGAVNWNCPIVDCVPSADCDHIQDTMYKALFRAGAMPFITCSKAIAKS